MSDPFYTYDRTDSTPDPITYAGSNAVQEILGEGGGGGGSMGGTKHAHPFKFIDASTTSPAAVKTQIASTSELIDSVYPLSTLPITGIGASGSYQDPITLTGACNIWLKGTVASYACTGVEVTKTDPTDGELFTFSNTAPYAQTAFYVLLASITAGSKPNDAGYDLSIGGNPFHLTQVAFNNLRIETRVLNGTLVFIPCPV